LATQDLQISVDARSVTGKHTRRLRASGIVPGVLFGKTAGSVAVQLDAKALDVLYRQAGRTSLVRVSVAGGRETRAPVLFLTARADEVDKVVGLEIGADDYLVKPFSVRELVSRIKALLRRAYGELADTQTGRTLRRGDLVIDLERRRVTRGTARISLTTTEFDLLRHMATKPGRVYTRTQLLELVRDYEALEADERTINVHISHIRDKIEPDPAQPRFIKTVRGVGYAFSED